MNHPISDALTGEEAKACMSLLLIAVTQHDRRGDTRQLMGQVLDVTRLAERLAHDVPDDSSWPNYDDIELPALPATGGNHATG